MSGTSSSQDPLEPVLGVFAAAWLEGKAPDPEDFCRSHPECGPELRAQIDAFLASAGPGGTPTAASGPDTEIPEGAPLAGRTLGDFRLLREIGRGGMGVVYEAEQVSLRRRVALKVLPAHLTLQPEAVSRFRREASTAARLQHPGIVQIHGIGQAEGAHFFAMEFVEGAPLSEVLNRMRREDRGSLEGGQVGKAVSSAAHRSVQSEPATEAGTAETRRRASSSAWNRTYIETVCGLVTQVADALEHAHKARILHRDVKPSNILVREDGSAMLTDFGLAREEGLPSLTLTGEFGGTPYYVSPEQAMARRVKVDHRTDIYSLGVTLYELLTLRLPFEGRTSQEVLGKIIAKEPPSPRQINPLLPRDLVTIVLKALEKDPDRRYATARDFASDIRAFLSYRPIAARPPSLVSQIQRVVRKHRQTSTVLTALLLLTVAAVIGRRVVQDYGNYVATKELVNAIRVRLGDNYSDEAAIPSTTGVLELRNARLMLPGSEPPALEARRVTVHTQAGRILRVDDEPTIRLVREVTWRLRQAVPEGIVGEARPLVPGPDVTIDVHGGTLEFGPAFCRGSLQIERAQLRGGEDGSCRIWSRFSNDALVHIDGVVDRGLLERIDSLAAPLLFDLILRSEDGEQLEAAIRALVAIGGPAAADLVGLIISEESFRKRLMAIRVAGEMSLEISRPELLMALAFTLTNKREHTEILWHTVKLLQAGIHGLPAYSRRIVASALVSALEVPDRGSADEMRKWLRLEALELLARLGREGDVEEGFLLNLLAGEEEEEIRRAIVGAIECFHGDG